MVIMIIINSMIVIIIFMMSIKPKVITIAVRMWM